MASGRGKHQKNNGDPLLDESDECDQIDAAVDEDPDHYFRNEIDFFKSLVGANLKDYSGAVEKLKRDAAASREPFVLEDSPYVCVPNPNADGVYYFKKSAIIWLLDGGVKRLSNDRTVRVAQTSSFQMRQQISAGRLETRTTLRLGDWCVFAREEIDATQSSGNFLLGRILRLGFILRPVKIKKRIIQTYL